MDRKRSLIGERENAWAVIVAFLKYKLEKPRKKEKHAENMRERDVNGGGGRRRRYGP